MGLSHVGALALGAVAACSFPHGAPGANGIDAAGEIDSADATATIDAVPDGSPDVDTDGDGLNDAVDNCPNAPNIDQKNFDGDKFGDVCDHCPHIASATDPDSDGDLVGDACDPRPATAGDARVLWSTFSAAGDITGWYDGNTGGTGTWQTGAGGLAQVATDPAQYASWVDPATWQHTYLAASFEIGTPQATATIGVCSGWDGSSFDCCNLNTRTGVAVAEAQTQLAQFSDSSWTDGLVANNTVDIVQDVRPLSNTCTFNGSAGATATRQTTPNAINAHVLVYMAHTTATFRYLFVVTIGQ